MHQGLRQERMCPVVVYDLAFLDHAESRAAPWWIPPHGLGNADGD